jgi:hypothetical protein
MIILNQRTQCQTFQRNGTTQTAYHFRGRKARINSELLIDILL